MSLPAAFSPFVEGACGTVLVRMCAQRLMDAEIMNALFEERAEQGYTRELTLSHLVDLMLDVACGYRPSPRAAFLARRSELHVSLTAFSGKLNRMELAVAEGVVRTTAARARELIRLAQGERPEPIPGFTLQVLDGNVLTGSEHRLKVLRKTRAAPLPGKSLAVYEYASDLVVDVVLCEDAYVQERALLGRLGIRAGQLWLADRNFCVRWFMSEIIGKQACFLIRYHRSTLPFQTRGRLRFVGRCATGKVYESAIAVEGPKGQVLVLRRIVLKLDTPTRAGEHEIVLITNLPESVGAVLIAETYRQRWTIEQHFQRLTDLLHCELRTLGHPRAALFAFSMSLVAGNVLGLVKAGLRAEHGGAAVEQLSHYQLVNEVSHTYRGMMLALPPERWAFLDRYGVQAFTRALLDVARRFPIAAMRKTTRGPKKPRKNPACTNHKHASTKRLLDHAARKQAC